MKRIWFAVVFLSVAVALCVTEQLYIQCAYKNLNVSISTVEKSIKNEKELETEVKNLKSTWKKEHTPLCILADHGTIDELDVVVKSIQTDDEKELKNALAQAKALNNSIYNNQKVTLSNIF